MKPFKKNITLILFIFCFALTNSQKSDSLKATYLNEHIDLKKRLDALSNWSYNMAYINPDSGIVLANELIKISETNLIKVENRQSNLIRYKWKGYYNLGINYSMLRDYSKAINYYNQILSAPKNEVSEKLIHQTFGNLGLAYTEISNYDKALICYFKDLEYAQKTKNHFSINLMFQNIARVYTETDNYPLALQYIYKSLALSETLHDSSSLATNYNALGNIYQELSDLTKSILYLEKALNYYKKINDDYGAANVLINLGSAYFINKNFQKSLNYYNEAIKLFELSNSEPYIVNAIVNSGNVYLEMGQNKNALLTFKDAYAKSIKYSDRSIQGIALLGMAEVFFRSGNFDKANQYAKEALTIANEIKIPSLQKETYHLLFKINKVQNNFSAALNNYQNYILFRDSIDNETKRKDIFRKELTYEFEKKSATDSIKHIEEKKVQQAKILTQQLQIKNAKTQRYGFISLSILLLIFAIVMYNRYKVIDKQKNIIEEQRIEIEIQKEHENSMLEQKLLRSQMNPHFIFNSLDAIQSFIYSKKEKEALTYLSKFAKLARQILENSREEYISLENEISTLQNYLALQQLLFEDKFNYSINVDTTIEVDNLMIPPMLAQPFIENALKHGIRHIEGKGQIEVSFFILNQNLMFEVVDNGVGFKKSSEINSAQNQKHRSMATAITEERLANINKNRIEKIIISLNEIIGEQGIVNGVKLSFEIPYIYNI